MSPELRNSLHQAVNFLAKYHYTVFLVLAALGIAAGIYSLLTVVQYSSLQQTEQTSNSSVTDEQTIKRIRELSNKSNTDLTLPQDQRINLFAE